MKQVLSGLLIVALLALAVAPAEAHGRYPHGWRGGFYAGYAPRYNPYWAGYYRPPRVYYPAVPVYPVYPVPPIYRRPHASFSYFSPGFSFSIAK